MNEVSAFAGDGGLVLGICNGFQILCEAGLLPGALTRNASLEFRCEPAWLRAETSSTPFTRGLDVGDVLNIPVSHGEGRYVADRDTLDELERAHRVVFRYTSSDGGPVGDGTPNGSMNDIAGIVSKAGNVLGMMPHPERACEALLGGMDGNRILSSMALLQGAGAV
jgi:phosphoribosylformylglycinamidine synthase